MSSWDELHELAHFLTASGRVHNEGNIAFLPRAIRGSKLARLSFHPLFSFLYFVSNLC